MATTSAARSNDSSRGRDRFEDYVPVAERIEKLYERFPDARINTSIVEHNLESGFVLMRAEVYRSPDDATPAATGHAFEVRGESYVNKTSYVENAETSAVGRALAMLGFEVKRGIASREEMQNARRAESQAEPPRRTPAAAKPSPSPAPPNTTAPSDDTQGDARASQLLRQRVTNLRNKLMREYDVTESVLNEMLGQHGCTKVEELTDRQAQAHVAELSKVLNDEINRR